MNKIYLDNASTTKIDEEVLNEMIFYLKDNYENPSSLHNAGSKIRYAIEDARKIIANSLKAQPHEIIFTSGGTESNNYALLGIANYFKKGHIITQKTEHASILKTCKFLEKKGFKVTYLQTNKEGLLDPIQLTKAITDDTILVTIMHANNEIGTIQPIKELYKICKSSNIIFHTDACQSYTKEEINKDYADLITINAHKIHGPKGIGALYINSKIKLEKLIHGGSQEMNYRGGTENVAGIVGFSKAVQINKYLEEIKKLQNYLIDNLLKNPKIKLNGPITNRLINNINIRIKNISGDSLLLQLSKKDISVSTGSACSAHEMKPSHTLKSIGLSDNEALSSIRISISKYTTKEELDIFVKELNDLI